MSTHDHLMSVCVDMTLAQGHRLRQDIVARANQVDEEDLVVLDEAEDALVVVACALWAESDDDALGGMSLDDSLSHGEGEQVALICEELEAGRQVTIIDHVQETIGRLLGIDFTEMNRLR